ncbi:glutactin-like [Culex pipiens pallens]|uniref:glutactin-like n=1 Tax=Culex pipiens pallens TaxID=42434 RepID=UPI001954C194|nr:glutactin-like [Culex pipiens pallens]
MSKISGLVLRGVVHHRNSAVIAARMFSSESPIVDLPGLGSLKGSTTTGAWSGTKILQFLNVRYGEPANGTARFKPTIPAKPWTGVLDVSSPKLGSPVYHDMKHYSPEQLSGNLEDCINLCVYTKDTTAKKPVIVYIHGGMFYDGAASHYPPNYLMEKDVVLVVPQYRLGPLGFLSTKTKTIPGNAGIHDVIMAFEWVQKYIEHFGGDPNQVTAMTQSSGASMVSSLLYSPAIDTEKLFHKLILQSGCCFSSWTYDPHPDENARDMAELAGCSPKASIEEVEQFLLDLDIRELMRAFSKHYRIMIAKTGVNEVGGCRLTVGCPHGLYPTNPYYAMRRGKVRKNLPMLIGTVKHDGTFALLDSFLFLKAKKLLGSKDINSYSMIDELNQIMGMDDPTCVGRSLQTALFYKQEDLASGDLLRLIPSMSDHAATCLLKGPVLKQAQLNALHQPNQTFLYSFDYAGEHTRFGFGVDTDQFPFSGGVHHSDDLQYLFPYPKAAAQLNERDTVIAKRMVDLWTSFAIGGVPQAEQVPEWPAMSAVCGPYLKINEECTVGQNYVEQFTATMDDPTAIAKKPKKVAKM